MTSRTTRTTSRTIRTLPISSPPLGGLLICMVLMVLEVVLVVLEVSGPPVPWGKFRIRKSLRPGLYSLAPPIQNALANPLGAYQKLASTPPWSELHCNPAEAFTR